MIAASLSFKNTHFQITDINGQPWLRGLQIASALGYKNPSSDITNLYDRNADEFTDSMTRVIELTTAGGKQQVRVFSLRGAHLLGMLARTKAAKEFRHWVLELSCC
ncbi:BRO-N domain-containing protein [Neisseria sicca]|uniref:BRO-N domain-containing protein n=1 Tax=Neisseria sicca TaxID=490 RepID=UPI000D3221DE|nr:Bro-N domain-containing protein [Neisseria sicca]